MTGADEPAPPSTPLRPSRLRRLLAIVVGVLTGFWASASLAGDLGTPPPLGALTGLFESLIQQTLDRPAPEGTAALLGETWLEERARYTGLRALIHGTLAMACGIVVVGSIRLLTQGPNVRLQAITRRGAVFAAVAAVLSGAFEAASLSRLGGALESRHPELAELFAAAVWPTSMLTLGLGGLFLLTTPAPAETRGEASER